jgi:hypothetical protein
MDWDGFLTTVGEHLPVVGPYVKTLAIIAGITSLAASQLTASFPPPSDGWRVPVWAALNWLARNVKFAQNAPPASDQ